MPALRPERRTLTPEGPVLSPRVYTLIFGFLIVVQFILLPLNYGILSGTNFLPKVAPPSGLSATDGVSTWLVWEGKNGMTYFRYDKNNKENERTLVTIPKSSIPKTEILSYDHLLSDLFAAKTEIVSDGEKQLTDK